jgi:hypothetical protein
VVQSFKYGVSLILVLKYRVLNIFLVMSNAKYMGD